MCPLRSRGGGEALVTGPLKKSTFFVAVFITKVLDPGNMVAFGFKEKVGSGYQNMVESSLNINISNRLYQLY